MSKRQSKHPMKRTQGKSEVSDSAEALARRVAGLPPGTHLIAVHRSRRRLSWQVYDAKGGDPDHESLS